jgi:hypothetical protein
MRGKFFFILSLGYLLFCSLVLAQTRLPQHPRDEYYYIYNRNEPVAEEAFSDTVLNVLGRWPWGDCYTVNTVGNLAYMGNGPTLHILDISDPASPQIVGEYLRDKLVLEIEIKDSIAYMGIGNVLEIFDITNSINPIKISEITMPGGGLIQIEVKDSLAFVTTAAGILNIVDISDLRHPFLRGGSISFFYPLTYLAVSGNYAYVGHPFWPYLIIADATNPDSLLVSTYWLGGGAESALVKDNLLYLGQSVFQEGYFLKIYNVAEPTEPVEIGSVSISTPHSINTHVLGITIKEQYAYITTRVGIYSLNIADPTNPFVIDSIMKPNAAVGYGKDIAYTNGSVFSSNWSGMWAVDVTQPDSLKDLAFFPTCQNANKVVLKNDLAFVACGLSGLWILDITDSARPERVANVNTTGWAADVAVSDSFAYVVNYGFDSVESSRGLYIIDISDIQNPQILSHHVGITKEAHFTAHINSIASSGKLVFITSATYPVYSDSVLEIIDVSDPLQPTTVGVLRAPYLPYHIALQDSFAYLATADSGLRIIDWHNPGQPQDVSNISDIPVVGITVNGSFAYVFNGDFSVVNISNPFSPFLVSSIFSHYGVSSIDATASGNFVYWAEETVGVVDVSDPLDPRQISTFGTRSFSGVDVYKDLVVATNVENGVWVLRNNAITSVRENKASIPNNYELSQNYPNPFNNSTRLPFQLAKRGHISLTIYDIAGKEVIRLINNQVYAPGAHEIVWDGLNNERKEVSSGIYLYELTAGSFREVKKMLFIK